MVFAVFLIGATILLIAFTPLREYIPGYDSTALRRQANALTYRTDSLEQALVVNERYINSIRKVLTGDVTSEEFNKDSILEAARAEASAINLAPSREDSLLREEVAREDKYNPLLEDPQVNFTLFTPVKGSITQEYDLQQKHYAVDIVAPRGTPVKAVSDGTVIFAEWTAETGYVILLRHPGDLISVYKHNASLTKEQGELVKAGEVIATVGNTGELTTGPHLHFELWSDGYPINPTTLIDFQ
jgi:murein DD-endopeptidase MepM/ murein hydrolase activator NlpD